MWNDRGIVVEIGHFPSVSELRKALKSRFKRAPGTDGFADGLKLTR